MMNNLVCICVLSVLAVGIQLFGPSDDLFSSQVLAIGGLPDCNSSDHQPFMCQQTDPDAMCNPRSVAVPPAQQQPYKDELVQSTLICTPSGCTNATVDLWVGSSTTWPPQCVAVGSP